MMYDYGIRLDVGGTIGSGHFFRCYAIAKELKKNGFKILFIVNNKKKFEEHSSENEFTSIILKSKNEQEEIHKCEKLAEKIKTMIIDLPFKNTIYSEKLKNKCKIIIIDDIGNKKIFSAMLFNGHIVKQFQKYTVNKKITKCYFGTKYMIIRKEFEEYRKNISKPQKDIKKILLTFGGGDDNCITLLLLPFLLKKNYKISVLIGPSFKNKNKIESLSLKNKNINIIKNQKNIAKIFAKHDLIISSSGITAYEIACLGIPCIFIPSDKYQEKTAEDMEKNGFGFNHGIWKGDFNKLEKMIESISSIKIRKKMFNKGRALVDGKGLSRVVQKIQN